MSYDPVQLPSEVRSFLTEYHLATLTTRRADGSVHVVPVGFSFDADTCVARVITTEGNQKVRNIDRAPDGARVALCQVDRGRWLTLEGQAIVRRDSDAVLDAVARYTARYHSPRENSRRVVIEVSVDRMLGRVAEQSKQ